MEKQKFKIRHRLLIGLFVCLLFFADGQFNHNRVHSFVLDHFWLVIFLPMALLALFMLVRGFYLEYRQ